MSTKPQSRTKNESLVMEPTKNQQTTTRMAQTTTRTPQTTAPMPQSTNGPIVATTRLQQKLRSEPLPASISLFEGQSLKLNCEVDNQQAVAQWLKDAFPVFFNHTKVKQEPEFERLFLSGDAAKGEQNLELRHAKLEDTGTYECQVYPSENSFGDLGVKTFTNITVYPQPATTTTTAPEPISSSGLENNHHQAELATPMKGGSQLQARDIMSLTKLSQATNNQSGGQPSNQTPFITPHASTAPDLSTARTLHLSLLSWPYLLLFLAVLLASANVYLIMSLIKRHKRRLKALKFHTNQQDNSLESDSNGGASSSSATSSSSSNGTATSRLCTANELSQCDLEPSMEVPEIVTQLNVHHGGGSMQMMNNQMLRSPASSQSGKQVSQQQHHQINMSQAAQVAAQCAAVAAATAYPINRICPLAPHLQQVWDGNEFVTIDSNGWVLEI